MTLESGGMSFLFASLVLFTFRLTFDGIAVTKEEESKILKEGVVVDLNLQHPFSNATVIEDALTNNRLVNLTGNIVAWTDNKTLSSFNNSEGIILQTLNNSWNTLTITDFAMVPWGLSGSSGSWRNTKTRIQVDSKSSAQYLMSLPINEESKKQIKKDEVDSSKNLLMEISHPAPGQGYASGGEKGRTGWDRFWTGYWFTTGKLYQRIVPLLSSCSVVGMLNTDAQGNIIIQAHPQFGMLLFRKVDFHTCAARLALEAQALKQISKAAEFGCYICVTVAGACLAVKLYSSCFPTAPSPPPPPHRPLSSDLFAPRRGIEGDGSVEEGVHRSLAIRAFEKSLECPITMQRMVDPVLW